MTRARAGLADLDEVVGDREREDETRADRLDIEGDPAGDAELGLHLRGRRRERVVRRRRADNDQINVHGGNIGRRQSAVGGAYREVGGEFTVGGDVSLADAGARDDPLIRGLDPLRELGVGDDPFRKIRTAPENLRSRFVHYPAASFGSVPDSEET